MESKSSVKAECFDFTVVCIAFATPSATIVSKGKQTTLSRKEHSMHAPTETRRSKSIAPCTKAVRALAAHAERQPGRRELYKLQAALQQAQAEEQDYSYRYDELEQELDTVTCKSRTRLIVRQLNLLYGQRELTRQRLGALNTKISQLFACLGTLRWQARQVPVKPWSPGLTMRTLPAA